MYSAQQKIAVAGGSGFIGRHVLEALGQRGHTNALNLSRPGFDLLDPNTWGTLPSGIDCVVMAIGKTHAPPDVLFSVNAVATGQFSRYCRKRGIKKFVLLSSGAVYGNVDDPTYPGLPENPTSDYGKSKFAGEQLVRQSWAPDTLAILRLYFPYGRGQKLPRLIPSLLQLIREGKEIICRPDGGPRLTMTHVQDIVDVILDDFVFGEKSGTFNVASTNQISIEELSTSLGAAIGIKPILGRNGNSGNSVSHPYRPAGWRGFNPMDVL